MSRRRRVGSVLGLAALLALLVPALGSAGPAAARARRSTHPRLCLVPGYKKPLYQLWRPHVGSAIGYARARGGDVSFAVRTAHSFYGYREDNTVPSASVIKAMFMVAYLNLPSVRNRALNASDFSLLIPMVTQSDNNAATQVRNIVGPGPLYAVAAAAHMTRFFFDAGPIWGNSQIDARDQTKFFLNLDSFVAPLHRWYALHLLASITPSQRWGVGQVPPRGWKLYFKGGWGSGTGAVDHQVALLVRGCARVSVAVMTLNDGTHRYGKDTLRGMFARLLRGLPTGPRGRRWSPRAPAPRLAGPSQPRQHKQQALSPIASGTSSTDSAVARHSRSITAT
ncbi:MAG: hypothetical protein ACXVQR_08375 [Solirubrobacteraceae bacterium]